MKKAYLPFVKDPLILASLVIFIISGVLFSCRKNDVEITSISQLSPKAKIAPAEIAGWLEKFPGIQGRAAISAVKRTISTLSSERIPFPVRWENAKQATINGKHVVRVPISNNTFLFFTKEKAGGALSSYVFKFEKEQAKHKKFSGVISWVSLNDFKLRKQTYKDGKLEKVAIYKAPAAKKQSKSELSTTRNDGEFWLMFWQWLMDMYVIPGFGYNPNGEGQPDEEEPSGSSSSSSSSESSSGSEIFTYDWATALMSDYNSSVENGSGYSGSSGSSSSNTGGGSSFAWSNYSVNTYVYRTTVEVLESQLLLTSDERTWLSINNTRALEIYHYLNDGAVITEEKKAICKAHLQKLMTDSEYATFVADYYQYVSSSASLSNYYPGVLTSKMWWDNEDWLDNLATISITENMFSNLKNIYLLAHSAPPPTSDEINTDEVYTLDNTEYGTFQQSQVWSNIAPVISPNDFVKWKTNGITNCFTLAKLQISKAGYTCNGYNAEGQTFKILHQTSPRDVTAARKGVNYILDALERGIPVVVGVSYAPGHNGNFDGHTDHYITIVGTAVGPDNSKNFIFYDNGSSTGLLGAHSKNYLKFDYTNGTITGLSRSNFCKDCTYDVTHIRKSVPKP